MIRAVVWVLLWLPACAHVYAQTSTGYPQRPIRVVVPFPPGGGADVTMRMVAEPLKAQLGQPLVIDNRGGASTIIGTELVAKAKPDGYTILIATTTYAINPSLHASLPYDPLKDLAPITLVAFTPYILVVHPSLPVKTVKDLIALARARPGQLTYASVGNGSATHLATEMLTSRAGVKITHVPYKGSAPALADLIGGHVSLYLGSMPASVPQARAGKLRAITVTSARRAPGTPEVPTIAESGLPGYEFTSWYGLFARAGTPEAMVDQLQAAVRKVLERADLRERLLADGNEAVGSTPAEFAAVVKADIAKYAKIVTTAHIRPD